MSDAPEPFTPEFEKALLAGTQEFNSLCGEDEHGDMQMTARGVKHEDIIRLAEAMIHTYGADLQSPNEDDQGAAVGAIIQIALFAGMSLQRHRQEELERLLGERLI